ncbi:MAG: hypothetical protein OXN17_22875 [Candidatus Poribacteria bacterium]|nr:hypothetical protein [Candidatus Poribacteria bacterium]
MNKIVLILTLTLVLGMGSVTVANAKEVKLVGAKGGTGNRQLAVDIVAGTVIVGAHADNYANIYVSHNNRWKLGAQVSESDGSFGWAVAIGSLHLRGNPHAAIVGAPNNSDRGDSAGAAYVYAPGGGAWKQQAKLTADDAAAANNFGHAVSIDGNTAIVGSPKSDDAGKNSGAAYIFVRDGARWNQQAKLLPEDLVGSDAFGEDVFVYGGTVVVGAPQHSHSGLRFPGAAYVFEREVDNWVQKAKLTASDAAKSDRFGHSVAMSGNTIIVGAPLHDTNAGKDAGVAYIFVPDGDTWKQQAMLMPAKAEASNQLGFGVATTGNIAIIGAPTRNEGARASGAAYAFVRVEGVWEEKEKVVPKDAAKDLKFGSSIGMSDNSVVISSHNAVNEGPGFAHGTAAYVYSSIEDFETPPFSVSSAGLAVSMLGQIKRTALYQNFPNPFNPETWLPFRLASDAPVTLRIYNAGGILVRKLDLGDRRAGDYLTPETAAYWDGRDQHGEVVSSGLYVYTLETGAFQATRKMIVLK